MATAPTNVSVVYDDVDEKFTISFDTIDGTTVRVRRSDDGGSTYQLIYDGLRTAGVGTHVFEDYLAPVAGQVFYRVAVSDDGETFTAAAPVSGVSTSTGWRIRRPGSPGMTLEPFVTNEGVFTVTYQADRAKRWPRGARHPIVSSTERRLDTVTLPRIDTFTSGEASELLRALNTERVLQLALPHGDVFWVMINHNMSQGLEDTPSSGPGFVMQSFNLVFDVVGAP